MKIFSEIARFRTKILVIFFISTALFQSDYGFAQQNTEKKELVSNKAHKHVFELKTKREIFFLTLGTGLNIYNAYLQNRVIPLTPMEISQLDPEQVNPFDRKTIDNFREDRAGDLLLYASFLIPLVVPLTIFKGDEHKSDWKVWAIMTSELLLINSGFNGIMKSSVLRTRPFVYNPEVSLELKTPDILFIRPTQQPPQPSLFLLQGYSQVISLIRKQKH